MTRAEALARLHAIVHGIDLDETVNPAGWWETSTGVAYGAARLAELEALVVELTDDH